MDSKCLVMISALVLLLLAGSVSAQTSCRADYTFAVDSSASAQDLKPFVDLLLERGYYLIQVYGFSSSSDQKKEVVAFARAQAVADRIFSLSDGRISAIPQLGFPGGKTSVFGADSDNQRVIITFDQLFQDEYVPAPAPGVIGADACPLVFYCDRTKLHKNQWFCLKSNEGTDIWYGPCDHDNCIGDLEFKVVSDRLQQELRNVVGDDPVSMNNAALALASEAKILSDSGLFSKSALLYQEALEIYLDIPVEMKDLKLKDVSLDRDAAFSKSVSAASSEAEAKRILTLFRRAKSLTPDNALELSADDSAKLESLVKGRVNFSYYANLIIVLMLAVFVVFFLVHLALLIVNRRILGRKKALDEAAKEIIDDIDRLETVFVKKKMLVDDAVEKLESLGK